MRYLFIVLFLFFVGCASDKKNDLQSEEENNVKNLDKKTQLNITILLDLSDRIDSLKNPDKPEHYKRDIAIVQYIAKYFVQDMENKGAYMAKGKMKIIFTPKPQDPNINILAQKLSVDLSTMDTKEKKEVHDNLETTFTSSLAKIYHETMKTRDWVGSDIWRFFKNDVKDYCIERDSNYSNILVIISDGYIYHEQSKDNIKNRYAYILPNLFEQYNLRNNSNWESEIDKRDFGLISKRKDLDALKVLVLEVTPSQTNKNDEDIIKYVLNKWLKEMNVKYKAIYNTDLPQYTKQRIQDFLSQ